MTDESIQPTRIDKGEYIKFKQWVQDVHGTTRGHLSTEIENALREYRQPDNTHDQLARIEDDIATIKATVADTPADGGTDIQRQNTPAPDNTTKSGDSTTKPKSNAPRSEKVEYILSKYYSRAGGSTTVGVLKDQIKSEFGFGKGVVEEYVDLVATELDAKKHPDKHNVFVWGDSVDAVREDLKADADTQLSRLSGWTDTDAADNTDHE